MKWRTRNAHDYLVDLPYSERGAEHFWINKLWLCEKLSTQPSELVSAAHSSAVQFYQLNPVFMEFRRNHSTFMRGWLLLFVFLFSFVVYFILFSERNVRFVFLDEGSGVGMRVLLSTLFTTVVFLSVGLAASFIAALTPPYRSPATVRLSRRTGKLVYAMGRWRSEAEFKTLVPVLQATGSAASVLVLLDMDEERRLVRRAFPIGLVPRQKIAGQAAYEFFRRYVAGELDVAQLSAFETAPPMRYGWLQTARCFLPVREMNRFSPVLGPLGPALHIVLFGLLTAPSWLVITLADAWLPLPDWGGYERDFEYDPDREGEYPKSLVKPTSNNLMMEPGQVWELPVYAALMLSGTALYIWFAWCLVSA